MAEPKKPQLFLVGAFGTTAIYAVWFLRNHETVDAFLEKASATSIALAVVSIGIVAGVGGAWAMFNGARTRKTAFNFGLGVPAMLFAADLAGGSSNETPAPTASPTAAAPANTLSPFRFVLSPVSAVAHVQTLKAEQRIERDLRAVGPKLSGSVAPELKSTDPEKRRAAVEILSRMGPQSAEVNKEIEKLSVEERDPAAKSAAVRAAAKVRVVPR